MVSDASSPPAAPRPSPTPAAPQPPPLPPRAAPFQEAPAAGSVAVAGRRCRLAGSLVLVAGLLLGAATALALQTPPLRSRLRDPPQGKDDQDQVVCTEFKNGTDFWTKVGLPWVSNIDSPQSCRDKCRDFPACGAWTWGRPENPPAIARVCFLKKLGPGERLVEHPNPHVVSGFACRASTSTSSTTTASPETRHPGLLRDCAMLEDVDYVTHRALKTVEHVTSAEVCRAACRATPGCEVWTWGKAPNQPGITHSCFLKRLEPGERPQRAEHVGVVSGLACQRPPGLAANASTPAPSGAQSEKAAGSRSSHSTSRQTTSLRTTTTKAPTQSAKRPSAKHTDENVPPGSLFCFTLMQPHGTERDLVAVQFEKGSSIFACDEYVVYSNKSISIAPTVKTTVVNISLECSYGGEFHLAMNTRIFGAVWAEVLSAGRFQLYAWTAKADPDCVFLPGRLRPMLPDYEEKQDLGLYLNNCRFGLHGPLEVFSRAAVRALTSGWQHCVKHFHRLCAGRCLWGEALFTDQCLSSVLKIKREDVFGLLIEPQCEPPKDWASCRNRSTVAFHPFRTAYNYRRCLVEALSTNPGRQPVYFRK